MAWWFPVRRCGHKSVVSLMKHWLELLSLAWLPSHPALTVNVVLVWHDAYDTYTMCQHVILLTELVTAHKHTHLNKKRAAVVQFYPPTVCPPELTFNTSTFFCSNGRMTSQTPLQEFSVESLCCCFVPDKMFPRSLEWNITSVHCNQQKYPWILFFLLHLVSFDKTNKGKWMWLDSNVCRLRLWRYTIVKAEL